MASDCVESLTTGLEGVSGGSMLPALGFRSASFLLAKSLTRAEGTPAMTLH